MRRNLVQVLTITMRELLIVPLEELIMVDCLRGPRTGARVHVTLHTLNFPECELFFEAVLEHEIVEIHILVWIGSFSAMCWNSGVTGSIGVHWCHCHVI